MKKIIILIFFTTIINLTISKSFALGILKDSSRVYRVNYWVTCIIDAGGIAANSIVMRSIYKKPDMTDADFLRLNKNSFNKFDQRAFSQDPSKESYYENLSYQVMGGTIALPLLLGLDKKIRKNWADIALMYLEMHMITLGIYALSPIGPTYVDKYRPKVYYDQLTFDQRRSGSNKCDFYSGHVATTVASTFFMVKVYSDYHPRIGWKKYLLYGLATLPGLWESDIRVRALKHFPSDNMVGMGIGMLMGIAVPALHKIKYKSVSLGMYSSNGAAGLSLNWKPDVHRDAKHFNGFNL